MMNYNTEMKIAMPSNIMTNNQINNKEHILS